VFVAGDGGLAVGWWAHGSVGGAVHARGGGLQGGIPGGEGLGGL
jgi:hypothetical protein